MKQFFKQPTMKKTPDPQVNKMVENYLNRQLWEPTYNNPKNLDFNGK